MRNRVFLIVAGVLVVLAVGLLARRGMGQGCCGTAEQKTDKDSCCAVAVGQPATCPATNDLSAASKAIDDAIAAVNAGEKDKALTALTSAKELLAKVEKTCKDACASCAKKGAATGAAAPAEAPAFANVKCPIMGNAIDPAKVPASLVREFNGRKVAFCCEGCPAQWDKLSDQQKQAKLDAVKAPAAAETK